MVYHPVLAGLVNLLSSCCQFLGPAFIASPVPDCLSMYKWTGSPPPPVVSVWVRGRGGWVGDVGPGGGRGAALSLSFVQVRWDSEDDVTMKALTASRCVCPSSELHRSTKHA